MVKNRCKRNKIVKFAFQNKITLFKMKKSYIGLGMLIFIASCGGHNSQQNDSVTEGDSILIDESTLISPDSATVAKNDSSKKATPQLKFSSAADLKDYLQKSPHKAAYSQGIIPLIADKSLEYAEKLVNNTHDGFIIVDKSRMKVIFYDKYGREKLNYGMACAKRYGTKHKKADSRTPEGFFTAEGIYNSTDWLFTNDEGYTSPAKGQFGPRFIRLKCPNTSQIGIHGTAAPWSIGNRASHGCIRVTNENILELVKHVTVGMPIIVVPGKRDIETNNAEGYESVWIPSSFDAVEPKPGVKEISETPKKDSEKKTAESVNQNDSTTNVKDSTDKIAPKKVEEQSEEEETTHKADASVQNSGNDPVSSNDPVQSPSNPN